MIKASDVYRPQQIFVGSCNNCGAPTWRRLWIGPEGQIQTEIRLCRKCAEEVRKRLK